MPGDLGAKWLSTLAWSFWLPRPSLTFHIILHTGGYMTTRSNRSQHSYHSTSSTLFDFNWWLNPGSIPVIGCTCFPIEQIMAEPVDPSFALSVVPYQHQREASATPAIFSDPQWSRCRGEIERLYKQGQSKQQILRFLERKHDFEPTYAVCYTVRQC